MDKMELILPPGLESALTDFYTRPEPAATFASHLELELRGRYHASQGMGERYSFMQTLRARPALAILILLLALALLTGVAYAIGRTLGYIPGVGIVEQGTAIRILKEPVSITRDGVTVAVSKAVITSDRTSISYQVLGVPHSAYPEGEAVTGCIKMEYLRLPDGTKMDVVGNMPSIPADVNEATFVMPCIFNTLPGTVPENWELPLQFVPAPPDMTVIPVNEILPAPSPSPVPNATIMPENLLVITKVLEIGDSYIIMGELRYDVTADPTLSAGSWWVNNGIVMTDGNGQKIPFTFVNEIEQPTPSVPNADAWYYKVDGSFIPPLTLTYQGELISPVGVNEQAEFEFDTGANPQPGDEWVLNKDFMLGGYNIRLVSISYSAQGYYFQFKADPGASANGIRVDIVGYTPNCGGGGGGDQFPEEEEFGREVCFGDPSMSPKGKLKAVLNFQALKRTSKNFQVQWSPEATQAGPIVTPTTEPGVCVTRNTLSQLAPAPAELKGKALLYQLMDDGQTWSHILVNLDGSQRQVLEPQASWSAFLPDGEHVYYFGQEGLRVLDIATGQVSMLNGIAPGGYNLQWSPDGSQVAFVGNGNDIFLSTADGANLRQMTNNADYKTLAGWSPDGTQIYITVPGLNGWVLRALDVATGAAHDLFTLEDASFKAPNVTMSPDGKWLAYRDRELSSLYIVRMDGTERHMVVKRASDGISAGFWSADGQWLAVSLLNSDTNQHTVILIQPNTCRAFLLPALQGDIEGLQLP